MKNFDKKTFNELAEIHHPHCVSIYMPTHRSNDEGKGYQQDKLTLKNLIKSSEKDLKIFGMSEGEIDDHLKGVSDLLEKNDFWTYQSDGLAIFVYKNEIRKFSFPIAFNPQVYVNSNLNLKPIVNFISDTQSCLILSLSLNHVELLQVNSTETFRIEVADLIPTKMTDTVGEDYEEKQLEGRVSNSKSGGEYDQYHGHGRSNDTVKKEEALRFFHQINNGLQKLLNEYDLPLIVACVDYLFAIYKEANSYQHLKMENISGNPEHESLDVLANKAMKIVTADREDKLKEFNENFGDLMNAGKSSDELEKIVPAAIGGRIKHLLITADNEKWGRYNQETHSIEEKAVRGLGDTDLVNLAVVETIKNGGEVKVINPMHMPNSNAEIAAIFRF